MHHRDTEFPEVTERIIGGFPLGAGGFFKGQAFSALSVSSVSLWCIR